MDDLGNVLTLMCVVVVVGCLAWGAVAHLVAKRRRAVVAREFVVVPDEQLVLGLARLAAAMEAERRREQSMPRDVHVRYWR